MAITSPADRVRRRSEARYNGSAVRVHAFRVRPDVLAHIVTHGEKPVATNRQRSGPWLGRIDGVNVCVDDDHVCGRRFR